MMTRKLFTLICLCLFTTAYGFAQRGGRQIPNATVTPGDSIAHFTLDSITPTHAYLSWGVTKRVQQYEISYQADSSLTSGKYSAASFITTSIVLPRDSSAGFEAWVIKAKYVDGTISPQALVVHHGIIAISDEIFSMVGAHCNGGNATDPGMAIFFEDLCIAAGMETICKINEGYLVENGEPLPLEMWIDTLTVLANDDSEEDVINVIDCAFGGSNRTGSQPVTFVQLAAWPNPVQDRLTVEFYTENASNVRLKLTDMTGRTVLSQTVYPDQQRTKLNIHVSALSAGIYMLHVQQEGQVKTHRILKK